MRYLIVDDEHLARSRLKELVHRIRPNTEVIEASNGEQAISQFHAYEPCLALVDIRMPGIGGIELAYHLSELENPPAVIFTTAHNEYAVQAFNANAIDYLLKPIQIDRLKRALSKAEPLTEQQNQILKKGDEQRTHIAVKQRGKLKLIPLEEVGYFKAENKYVIVKTRQGEFLLNDTLNQLEQDLTHQFIRIHRNALISTKYLKGMEKISEDKWQVFFQSFDEKLEVSRRQKSAIRNWLKGNQN